MKLHILNACLQHQHSQCITAVHVNQPQQTLKFELCDSHFVFFHVHQQNTPDTALLLHYGIGFQEFGNVFHVYVLQEKKSDGSTNYKNALYPVH